MDRWFWKIFGVAIFSAIVIGALQLGNCADKGTTAEHIGNLTAIATQQVKTVDRLIEDSKEDRAETKRIVEAIHKLDGKIEKHIERDWKDHTRGGSDGGG